jgi:hypothetical protein
MEAYNNKRPITPPSDHQAKRMSGSFSGAPIPNLDYVDQTMPTTATSNMPQAMADNKKSSLYTPALKNMDPINPTTNQDDGLLGRNAPQHNLAQENTSMKRPQENTSMNRPQENTSMNRPQENTSMNPPQKNVASQDNAQFGSQRNQVTSRIEKQVYHILHWNEPVRSGIALASVAGTILLTRWYSPLQMAATVLTMATLVNLFYVNFMVQSQRVISDNQTSHPYQNVIRNDKSLYINKGSVTHYTSVAVEVAETVIRALTRIVFVEDTLTSLKWMVIFFMTWKVSAYVATMDILLTLVISAFIFPHLYMSNKDIVDSHLQKGQHMVQAGLENAQVTAEQGMKDAYGKAKTYFYQTGTSNTDAKNTMNDTSATLKDQ